MCGDYDGPKWQDQTAASKFSKLRTVIRSNNKSAPWPGTIAKAELFIESMDPSFDFVGDDFPKQGLFNLETRQKLIHSVGSVMNSRYVSVKNNYTGLFQGCENVVLRFSVATEINKNGGVGAVAPGIALKFMRDKIQSGNVFAMYSLIGQSSMNLFKHDLTNHVPDLPSDAPTSLKLVRNKFSSTSDFPVFIGLSELASYDEKGRAYPNPNFPFRIQFHPNKALHNAFSDNYTGDWEDLIAKAIFPGQHVYDVYAQATPSSTILDLIGKVYATESPTRSYFADKSLFYQHTRFENDLKYHPEWEQKAKDIMNQQRTYKGEGYTYPDLPW